MAASGLSLYARSVSIVGAALALRALLGVAHTPGLLQWLLFSALVVLAGRFTTRIASVEASISVSDTFFIAAALLFGPGPAMITLAVDGFVLSWRKGHGWDRIWFNAFAPALSLWVAAQAFVFSSGVPPLATADIAVNRLLLPLLSLTLIYFGLNSGLTAVAVALESHQPVEKVWRQHLAALSLSYFAAASTALCLVLVIKQVGLLAVPIFLPVLAEFHLTLRSSCGRAEDAERHLSEVDRLYMSTVETLAMAMDAKDTGTHSHVRRVQALTRALAGALHITDLSTLKALETAALLHDTGKLAVPEYILNKPGPLTAAEFEEMKRHVDVGADILSLVPFPYPVVPVVRGHHENWDGTGYPRGIAGTDIPLGARILSVVDCYDALTSDRPYRRRMTDEESLAIITERRGTMYDPQVVDAFVALDPAVRMAESLGGKQAQVLEQLRPSRTRHMAADERPKAPAALSPLAPTAAGLAVLPMGAGLPLAARTLGDVLLRSTRLVQEVVPESTGAWFIPDPSGRNLDATEPFGPGADILLGRTVRLGDKLTGWVGAYRQPVLNSDAALDLGDQPDSAAAVLGRCLSLPVLDGDGLAAVLTLYAPARQPFSEDQAGRLQEVASTIGKAIRTASAV